MRLLSLCLLLSTGAALADPLADARAQVTALDFKAARKSLKAAEGQPGLTRAQVMELYELSGIVAGTLNEPKVARDAFTRLLNLEPTLRLSGKYAPRVTTPFLEAKGWVAEKGTLALEVTPPEPGPGPRPLVVKVTGDVFSRVQVLRVAVREGSAPWRVVEGPAPMLEVPVTGARVAFHVQVLAEQGWQLAARGTEAEPVVVELPVLVPVPVPPATVAVLSPPPLNLPAPVQAPVSVTSRAAPSSGSVAGKAVGWTGVGLGMLAVGFSLWEWLGALQLKSTYDGASLDGRGVVTGMTRSDALRQDGWYRGATSTGAISLAVGAVLIGSGVAFIVVSGASPAERPLTLAPALVPGGGALTLSGALP